MCYCVFLSKCNFHQLPITRYIFKVYYSKGLTEEHILQYNTKENKFKLVLIIEIYYSIFVYLKKKY